MTALKSDTDVNKILEEIHTRLTKNDMELAKDFGLDAPERAYLMSQAMIIKEQRETNLLLEQLYSLILPEGEPPSEQWQKNLNRRMLETEMRG